MLDIMEHYGLVVFLARKAHRRLQGAGVHLELDTLVQEGAVGLVGSTFGLGDSGTSGRTGSRARFL